MTSLDLIRRAEARPGPVWVAQGDRERRI